MSQHEDVLHTAGTVMYTVMETFASVSIVNQQ